MTLDSILPHGGYSVTSGCDHHYNCIAWAARDSSQWWEPDPHRYYYWPRKALRSYSLAGWVSAFECLGFVQTSDAELESGFERIAIYAWDRQPTHVARQLENGSWTSKLGAGEDVQHRLEDLEGYYGPVIRVMKRASARHA